MLQYLKNVCLEVTYFPKESHIPLKFCHLARQAVKIKQEEEQPIISLELTQCDVFSCWIWMHAMEEHDVPVHSSVTE